MNSIIQVALTVFFFSNVAVASDAGIQEGGYHFVGDEIAMNICAAALKSKNSMVAEAKKLHLTRKSLKDVTCNGQSPTDFAKANKSIIGSKALASAQ